MNASEITERIAELLTVDAVICFAGLVLLGAWLIRNRWGTRALADSAVRRNSMPIYLPFLPLFIWFAMVAGSMNAVDRFWPGLEEWQNAFLKNIALCAASAAVIVGTILLARATFVRRLRGFGLNFKTIGKDLGAAFVNLLAIWPLVMLVFLLTIHLGELFYGQDFTLERHEELSLLTEHRQTAVRVIIAVTAVLIVPAAEEMLFRGLFQSMIRSLISSPWAAIVLTSGLFAMIHANAGHWPALFVLAIAMGYSYEKSGSLWRPIFIHCLFNAISVISTLYE